MSSSQRYTTETSIRVRYAETDAMGVVHHSNYIVWFEAGRSDYARERGKPYGEIEKEGYFLLVAEVHARYIKPALYDQLIVIRTWVEEIKSRQITFGYEVCNQATGEILVTATTKHVCIEKQGKVVPIPASWRAWA